MLQKALIFILSVLKKLVESKSMDPPALPKETAPVPQAAIPLAPAASPKPRLEPKAEEKLEKLYPPFADTVRAFVLEARKRGMNVSVFQGLRTFEEQKALYQKGRDANLRVVDRKKIVTNAPPGLSMHNYGLAVDLVFDGNLERPGWQWSWDNKHPWKDLAVLGRDVFKLKPAYFWRTFPEGPHYEMSIPFTYRELSTIYQDGGLDLVWRRLDLQQDDVV